MLMMPVVVMQHPQIGSNSGVQSIKEFEQSVKAASQESWRMLMVMIYGADLLFRNNHGKKQRPNSWGLDTLKHRIKSSALSAKGYSTGSRLSACSNALNRKVIFSVLKIHLHAILAQGLESARERTAVSGMLAPQNLGVNT